MMSTVDSTILCCHCGVVITPNSANSCAHCLQTRYDITETFNKTGVICKCKGCDRFQKDTSGWMNCDVESPELLAFCLKKIKGIKTVKVVDASFIWTEPHSKRIKIKLTVQKEVLNNVILQETVVIEYIVQNKMCTDCHKEECNQTWNSVVQVRQKVQHKRTFLFLEQLIIKHRAYDKTIKINPQHEGVDFYFAARNHAVTFVDFLDSVIPIKYKCAKKIISQDIKSNIADFNHTFAVEIVPLCKDDYLCLPIQVSNKLGNIGQLCVVLSVYNTIKLLNPLTLQTAELSSERFYQQPFRSLCNSRSLLEFIVLDVEAVEQPTNYSHSNHDASGGRKSNKRRRAKASHGHGGGSIVDSKFLLVQVEVAKLSDFGVNDKRYLCLSHLGYILKPNDVVLGYDAESLVCNDADLKLASKTELPEIVLVRKHYPVWRRKQKQARNWKLKALAVEAKDQPGISVGTSSNANTDLEFFMRDLEEDKELRSKVNLYKDPLYFDGEGKQTRDLGYLQAEEDEEPIEEDIPQVDVGELLDELKLDDADAAPDHIDDDDL